MATILLLANGSGGDVLPLVRIGGALRARGHQVTLLTHCMYEQRTRQAGLDFIALDTPEEYERTLRAIDQALHPQDILALSKEHLLANIPANLSMVERRCPARNDMVLVAANSSHIFAHIIAERLAIPLLVTYVAPSIISAERHLANKYGKQLAADINHVREQVGLPPMHNWDAWRTLIRHRIGMWPDWFAAPEPDWPARCTLVGFICDQPARAELPDELDQVLAGAAPVLITHGTSMPASARFFQASAEACRLLNCRAVLVTPYEASVPNPLPEQVTWFKYLPFDRLMPRVRAVIHHGGIGTSGQAIAAAVPQLVLPLGADRPDNAARLKRLGVAELLRPPQWRGADVAGALHRLMHAAEVPQRCRELAGRLAGVDPVAAACDLIERWIPDRASPAYPIAAPQRKVLLTTVGTWGDVIPFLRMGRALHERGYAVALLTHARYEGQARQAGLDFIALDTPEEYQRFAADVSLLNTPRGVPAFFRRHVLPRMAAVYRTIVQRDAARETLLITRAMPGMAALMAAETLGVPVVSVLMAPSDMQTVPIIERALGPMLGSAINRVRAEVGLAPIEDWPAWLRLPAQYIGIWPEWFAPATAGWSANLALIGFMGAEARTGQLPEHVRQVWGDGPGPLLITHGTSTAAEATAFSASIAACELLDRPGLVVTPHKYLLPDPLPAGVRWAEYVPFADLMPHLTAIIHHGGLGTLQQALAAGTPQLILPDSTERKKNAIRLQKLGGGDWLPPAQWRADRIADALNTLIHSPKAHIRRKELAAWIYTADPAAAFDRVIAAMAHGAGGDGPAEAAPVVSAAPRQRDPMDGELRNLAHSLSAERRALLTRRLRNKP